MVQIRGNEELSEYLGDIETVDYEELKEKVLGFIGYVEEVETETETETETESEPESFTVTFKDCSGNVFATQTVANGGMAIIPTLKPETSGRWDFDFTTAITADTEISWIVE